MAAIPEHVQNAFYEGPRGIVAPLMVNDVVIVKSGRHPGGRAWVIQIEEAGSQPAYLVEYDDGSDGTVLLSNLVLQVNVKA